MKTWVSPRPAGPGRLLPPAFYRRADVVCIARDLIGKFLVTCRRGRLTAGMIVETEAYAGTADRACHAHRGRRTPRNEVMYAPGGVAYVYCCYGLHALLNVVTHRAGAPYAVLIRAIEPVTGIDLMRRRRGGGIPDRRLTAGPGILTRALDIGLRHNGVTLAGPEIRLEDRGVRFSLSRIAARPRIGVEYAGPDARKPWRFYLRGNPWVSRP